MEDVIETTLLRGQVKLIQPKKGFHASVDTVFLAAAVPATEGQKILDAGCGVGSAGFCVRARIGAVVLDGIDIQPEMIDLAGRNANLNGWQSEIHFVTGDIRDNPVFEDLAYDHVMINPPYLDGNGHTPSPDRSRATALGNGDTEAATLADWLRYAHRKLKSGGSLTMVHRADRLDDMILLLRQRRWFGNLTVYPLWSKEGKIAKRVIVQAYKDKHGTMVLHPGMIVHKENGEYSSCAKDILEGKIENPILTVS